MSELGWQKIMERHPQAKDMFERNPVFREAVEEMMDIWEHAKRELTEDDYLEFLRDMYAMLTEWHVAERSSS